MSLRPLFSNRTVATIFRKPDGTPLCLEILISSDDINFPEGDEITFIIREMEKGEIHLIPVDMGIKIKM